MKQLLSTVGFAAVLTFSAVAQDKPTPSPTPQATPAEADYSARSKALELAGAFSNDGYKIRDGYWAGEIAPDRPQFLEVNLFADNEYWFSAAATAPARKIAVTIFDEKGKPVDFQVMDEGATAAAGFIPEISGRYFIKLAQLQGEKSDFCLIYSYK